MMINTNGRERLVMQWLSTYMVKVHLYINNSIEKLENTQEKLYISNYYPNPINPVTQIIYSIVKTGHGRIKVFDITGRRVDSIINKMHTPGKHTVTFNAKELSNK